MCKHRERETEREWVSESERQRQRARERTIVERERELVMVRVKACHSNGIATPRPYSLISPSSSINWEPGAQIHEPNRDIVTKNHERKVAWDTNMKQKVYISKSTEMVLAEVWHWTEQCRYNGMCSPAQLRRPVFLCLFCVLQESLMLSGLLDYNDRGEQRCWVLMSWSIFFPRCRTSVQTLGELNKRYANGEDWETHPQTRGIWSSLYLRHLQPLNPL